MQSVSALSVSPAGARRPPLCNGRLSIADVQLCKKYIYVCVAHCTKCAKLPVNKERKHDPLAYCVVCCV